MRVTGQVAVVTGAASGLGRATVRRLVADGANVVGIDLPGSDGAAVCAELGGSCRFVPADVTDADALEVAVDAARELGAVRIAVACAGVVSAARTVGRDGPLPLDDFARVVHVNLVGTFNLVRLAAGAMAGNDPRDGDRGVVVMTASVAAYDGQVGQAAYAASKAGVAGMTLPVARDLSRDAIRVVTIAPGTFDTPLLASLPDEARASLAEQVPHPARLGDPAEFASLVAHVVDNGMLNGEVIRLDGAIRMAPR